MTAQMQGIGWILYAMDYGNNTIFELKAYTTYGMLGLAVILILYFQLRSILGGDVAWPHVKWEDMSPRPRKVFFVAGLMIFVAVFLTAEMIFFDAILPAPKDTWPVEPSETLQIISP